MFRFVFLVFGSGAYAVSFATILYAIGFVANLWVPKGIDSGAPSPLAEALVVDALLLTVFALQHSVMARPRFKRFWTLVVPKPIERSTYVLFASLSLILLFWQWRPMPMPLWTVTDPTGAAVLQAASFAGLTLVLVSTFLISHFELFGVKQVVMHWLGRAVPETAFRTPLLYNLVRHPIYLGFIIAFWATPTMTAGHLLFAALTTAYIVIGIQLEERDLVRFFGKTYLDYRERVAMLVPGLRWKRSPEAASTPATPAPQA
ncbi:MAG: methanethiol S-methyltransferase [Microvirga sp.]